MTRVIDASAMVKLYLEEQFSDVVERLVEGDADAILAPDLIWAEAANAIWKRQRRGELPPQDAAVIVRDMLTLPLDIEPSPSLLTDAVDLAMRYERSVYDCLYLALAARNDCAMFTADQRLVNALSGTPLQRHVQWIGTATP